MFKHKTEHLKLFIIIIVTLGQFYFSSATEVNVSGQVKTNNDIEIDNAMIKFISNDDGNVDSTTSDVNGNYSITLNTENDIIDEPENLPVNFKLLQNYPNPFNPGTWIPFQLPVSSKVEIVIFNILGQQVKVLVNGQFPAGQSKVYWNGADKNGHSSPAGVYFYRLKTDGFYKTRKMLLMDGGDKTGSVSNKTEPTSVPVSLNKTSVSDTVSYQILVTKDGFHKYREDNFTFSEENQVIQKDLVMFPTDSFKLYITESDYLANEIVDGNTVEFDNSHQTFIVNITENRIKFDVEFKIPDGLIKYTDYAPLFGSLCTVPIDFEQYWQSPEILKTYYVKVPGERTSSYIWRDLTLDSLYRYKVVCTNYYADNELDCFNIDEKNHQYLDLKANLNFTISESTTDTALVDVQINPVFLNDSPDTMYNVEYTLFIPRVLFNRVVAWEEEFELYTIESDTLIHTFHNDSSVTVDITCDTTGQTDGFGNQTTQGQRIIFTADTILPGHNYEYTYQMNIKPQYDKFEIYPVCRVKFDQITDNTIWERSIITIPNMNLEYSGDYHYLRAIDTKFPAYYLFSIDNSFLSTTSPWDSDTTFYYPYPDEPIGKILFTSSRSGKAQLYTMNPDGTDIRQITAGEYSHSYGRWSPDGKKVVCSTSEDWTYGGFNLVVIDLDTGERTILGYGDNFLSWSPNMQDIVYSYGPYREIGLMRTNIYIVNYKTLEHNIILESTGEIYQTPRFSRDGALIAYSTYVDSLERAIVSEICTMDKDGDNFRRITYLKQYSSIYPCWSSDGNTILFCSAGKVYIVDVNTSETTLLQESDEYVLALPCYSPDEDKIIFIARAIDGSTHEYIYMMDSNGENSHRIIDDNSVSSCDWYRPPFDK